MRKFLIAFFTVLNSQVQSFQPMVHNPIRSATTSVGVDAVVDKPFGTWESPITSSSITAGSVGISNLKLVEDELFWTEGRPQEAGRTVLCRYAPNSEEKNERNAVDVTPKQSNIRTLVHEYGGGSLVFGKTKDVIYFSEFIGQNICKISDGLEASVTQADGRFRYADGVLSEDGETIYCVREDHEKPAPKDVVNEIVAITVTSGNMKVLATGNDFYAAPRVSPDGKKIAYVTWQHPNMPWDATELRVLDLDGESAKTEDHELIAGEDSDTSVLQPLFHHTTGDLYFISDKSGYYNIYRAGTEESVLPMQTDFGGAAPGWTFGSQGFNFLPDGRFTAQYQKDGCTVLIVANVASDGSLEEIKEYGIKDGLPMKFGGVQANEKNELYFLGGSPSTPASIYKWNLEIQEPAEILGCSSDLSFPDDVISVPQQVEFPCPMGTAFGYYYAPKNGAFKCSTEKAPPLLVKCHGGPTACTGSGFNPSIQYWTSRGFAVLDVDYGGSTGYGRDYRRRLRKSWGIVDIDDVCAGAKYLVAQGLADDERLCIDGGSAGGYTTLGALAFRDVFKAGTSLYGIGDLTALAGDTHKFESRYLDGLIGKYPDDEAIYKERSPIESVDTLSCPILLLQGQEDKVVPPNQAEKMHEALVKKKIPSCLKIYKGEQHGFRQAENIEDALDSELAFYGRVFGMDVPNSIELEIENMA